MTLYEGGFQIIRNAILDDDASALRIQLQRVDDWATIFSHGDEQHGHKLQATVPESDALTAVASVVSRSVSWYNQYWEVRPGS